MFLDTNVLVSAFATRGLCEDVLRLVLTEHTLVTGDVVLDEVARVLRDRFRMPRDRVDDVLEFLRSSEMIARPAEPSPLRVRDEDDRWILATAIAGAADVLVTGDRDLLVVARRSPLRILNPREFWELVTGR